MSLSYIVIGTGLDLNIALELVSFGNVYYCPQSLDSFPTVQGSYVGSGFDQLGLQVSKDVYSLLSSILDKNEWCVIFTDTGFGDWPKGLRDAGFKVFGPDVKGTMLEEKRELGKDAMRTSGILTPEFFFFETLEEVIDFLDKQDGDNKYALKVNEVSGTLDTTIGTVDELKERIEGLSEGELKIPAGYSLEEHIEGVEAASAAFFNGEKFLFPVIISFESEWGGYLYWDDGSSPIFREGLALMQDFLKEIGYKGVIDLNGIWTREGFYYGIEFSCRFGYPWGRVFCKMIENLDELFVAVATGKDCRIKLYNNHAYFISYFSNLDFEDSDDFVYLNRIYDIEIRNQGKFGVTFDRVFMDSDGEVYALPGYPRLFQAVGFGNDYQSAVMNAVVLHKLVIKRGSFKHNKDKLIEDIRDRVIFFESWCD